MSRYINKHQKFLLIIPIVPILGIIISILTERFRIVPDYHWIYTFGKIICFLFWFVGIVWAFVNATSIIQLSNVRLKEKIVWLFVNFITIIIFTIKVLWSI